MEVEMDNEALAIEKARGDPDAARSRAATYEHPYLLRKPYLNIQNANLLGSSSWLAAEPWRRVLYSSPTVWACVKAQNDQLASLPWHVTTRDKSERHKKRDIIDYYTFDVIEQFNGENLDTGMLRTNRDVLTIPQGGNCEIVRKISGRWNGEVDRVENIDGGTLTPTGNYEYPLIQRDPRNSERYVVFKRDQIRRVILNPRPEFSMTGYQQAPLEMCYLAIDALSKGDFYYLNLLTDTPSAGILDLADFTKQEAVAWAKSWRELLTGSEALKTPILYEHEKEARWIPFGVSPEQLMLPDVLQRYTRIVHACFGLYTQDTGLSEEAGGMGRSEVAMERRSWRRFNAHLAIWENFWNSILPRDLVFKFEEINIEETERLARAAVARANAIGILMRAGALGIREARREASETGLIETYINTEEIPEDVSMPGAFGGGINPVVAGQSRWQEQRLPQEGRQQALPAPKVAPREEWQQRVRPKSKALIDDFSTVLHDAFTKLLDIPEDSLKQLIKDAGVILVDALREAKSFTDDAYTRWLEEFDRLMDDEDSSLIKAKAIIRKRKQSTKIIEDLLKSDRWWDISDPELLILASMAFKSAYEDALDAFAEEIQQTLQEEGYDIEFNDYTPSLVNTLILTELDSYAHQMVDNLNQGSQYYLKHALSRTIANQLSKPEYRQRIDDGEDAAIIIATMGFIEDVAQAFKSELSDLIGPRAIRAAEYELSNIEGAARLQAMKSMGLGNKQWNAWGPDPCEICLDNAAQGSVPLDFQYKSAFGGCLWPQAHPFGHCGITFDKPELRAILDTGGEITLYRGE